MKTWKQTAIIGILVVMTITVTATISYGIFHGTDLTNVTING